MLCIGMCAVTHLRQFVWSFIYADRLSDSGPDTTGIDRAGCPAPITMKVYVRWHIQSNLLTEFSIESRRRYSRHKMLQKIRQSDGNSSKCVTTLKLIDASFTCIFQDISEKLKKVTFREWFVVFFNWIHKRTFKKKLQLSRNYFIQSQPSHAVAG